MPAELCIASRCKLTVQNPVNGKGQTWSSSMDCTL